MQKIVSMCIHPCLLKIHISVHTLSLSRSSFYNHSRRSQTREPTEDTFLALPVPLFYYHFCFYFVSLVTTAHYNPSQIPKYKDQGSSLFQLKSCSSCHQEWPNTPWFTVRSLPSSPPSVPGLLSGPPSVPGLPYSPPSVPGLLSGPYLIAPPVYLVYCQVPSL